MNLKQLEAFVCVAEMKSFSKAARKLYLTQPTVSAHINSLEKELESRLFIRTTKDVLLSSDGERLYENAKQMLQLEKAILKEFREKDSVKEKTIIVGASTVPGQYILPQILSLFCRNYPGNQLNLIENDSMGVINMVVNGEVEVGFTGTRTDNPNCVFEPFYKDRLVIITPNTEYYCNIKDKDFPAERFYEEPVIVREEGSGTRMEAKRYLRESGIEFDKLRIVATISNQETIKKSVSSGMGIAIVSEAAAEDFIQSQKVLKFTLNGGEMSRRLYMVWNKTSKPGAAARTFVQFVRELYEYL